LATCLTLSAHSAGNGAIEGRDQQEIDDQWVAAFNKGDAAALGQCTPKDAYVFSGRRRDGAGTNAIIGFWGEATKQPPTPMTTVHVLPLAYRRTRDRTLSSRPKKRHRRKCRQNTAVFGAGSGGQWKLGTDIWNMNTIGHSAEGPPARARSSQ